MNRRTAFIILVAAFSIATAARSGHELPVYPSYYPHEIELATVAPERAAALLLDGKIQAFIGGTPRFPGLPPDSIASVESLGSFLVVRVNPSSPLAGERSAVCTITDAVVRDLAGKSGDLIFHPYPVTPFHGDYLHHVDRAEAEKARILDRRADSPGADIRNLKVKTSGESAQSLVRPAWRSQGSDWDVEVADIGAADLIAASGYSMNGWLGPTWIKVGWFHASLLLGGQAGDDDLNHRVNAELRNLQTFAYDGAVERINLERSLVAALTGGCHARVAGYTVKREYFSTVFTAGIENIAHDSMAGFNSPMFIRTVKLKDFPWNGWLALGIDATPAAAWNPVAGFTDNFGRLMWSAVGDPALIPAPYDSAWVLNRISDVQSCARR
jgi:hypothetical protein